MTSNPALPFPGSAPLQARPRTLNDFRVGGFVAEPGPTSSALNVSGFVLVSVLTMGAFVMLDPFGMFGPGEVTTPPPASPAVVPQTKPAEPVMQQIIAPQATAPTARSVGESATTTMAANAPIASATVAQPPVTQAARAPAPVVQHRAAASASESRGRSSNKAAAPIARAAPEEQAAPPVIVVKPEAQAGAPVNLNRVEEVKEAPKPDIAEAPKPAAAGQQPAEAKEDSN